MNVFHLETDKEVPGQFAVFRFFRMLYGEVNFDVGEHSGTFGGVYSFQFYQSGGIGTETVFFNEEGHENTVEQAYQIIAVHTVENVVRKRKLQFAVNTMRLIE